MEQEEVNPFDQFDTQADTQEQPNANPFDQFDNSTPTRDQVLSGEDPLEVELNRMRESGEFDKAPIDTSIPTEELTKSKNEIYDVVKNQAKYKELNKYENSLLYNIGSVSIGDNTYTLGGRMPQELIELRKQRDKELEDTYKNTGSEDSLFGIPIRTQEVMINNPDFDPSKPPGEDNPETISKKYMVDTPTKDAIHRMGYQVLENVIGGVGDFILEGKLTSEGRLGKYLPDTVPNETGEKFATELTTFILGPNAIGKTVSKVSKGVGVLAPKIALMIPEEAAQARAIYTNVLQKTGSATQAFKASNSYMKNVMIGLSLGVQEAVVAPDNSEGMVLSPKTVENMGFSPERARDISFIADTPIVGMTLRSLGSLYKTGRDKFVLPTVGGLRNVNVFGASIGNVIPLTEKQAGLKTLLWLDPNMVDSTPTEFAFRTKVLADSLERNAQRNLSLGKAKENIKLDTPAAFTTVAKDYYRVAYQHLKDQMGPEDFSKWVDEQAGDTANRLYELRTSVLGENEVSRLVSKDAYQIDRLFTESADTISKEGLIDAQMRTGQILGGKQIGILEDADIRETRAVVEADRAKDLASRAISDDPEFNLFLSQSDSPLGSLKSTNDRVQGSITEKTYNALKKLKLDSDSAYKKIADSGTKGDPESFIEIIKNNGMENDPVLKKLAEDINSDPSFGNIYNNVRNRINDQIKRLQNSPDQAKLQTLYDLRKNINEDQLDFLRSNGDADVINMVDEAKSKYQLLRQTFYDNKQLGNISNTGLERMSGEKLPVGPDGRPQRATDFKIELSRHIQGAFDSTEGNLFRESLQRATKLGDQDITPELNDLYVSKAINNLTNKLQSGQKETVGTLRASLRGIIEPLEGLNSPMVDKFRRLESKIQTLENTSSLKESELQKIKEEVANIRKEAGLSVLSKFVYKPGSPEWRGPLDQTGVNHVVKQMFTSKDSSNQIKEILKEAEKLGDQGQIVKEALQGTYIDSLGDRLMSRRQLGIAGVEDGVVQNAFKINETNFERIFAPGSKDMATMQLLFKDQPEILDQIKEASNLYLNMTKTTPNARNTVLGSVDKKDNPEFAIGALTSIIFGPLSRTGARVRKITGPLSVESLEQVKAANHKALIAMITDPKEFSRIAKDVGKGEITKQTREDLMNLLMRAGIRTSMASVDQEMSKLK